jgi:aspartate aminotransferase
MIEFRSDRMSGIEKTLIRQVNDRADSSCINLGLGQPVFPTPASIRERLVAQADAWSLGYTPNAGLLELRELVARRDGRGLGPDNVCVAVGAEEALFAALMVLVNPGDEVLIPDPGFPSYASITRLAGGTPVGYTLSAGKGFIPDVDEVGARLGPRTRALVLNSPHNPTGAVYPATVLKDLAELCRSRGLTVLSDEVYREVVYAGPAGSISSSLEGALVIDSLSKAWSMTGWRLGWCVGPAEIIELMGTFNQLAVSCPPAISQKAAVLALSGVADEEKRRNLEELGRRRAAAVEALEEFTDLKYVPPLGTFYVYVDISSRLAPGRGSLDVALELIDRHKVVTIPGRAFGRATEGFLRLSFAASPDEVREGIRRLGLFFGRD